MSNDPAVSVTPWRIPQTYWPLRGMFVEVDIRDVLRLPAQCIVPDIVPAVHFALLEKYVNRVLNDQGLCVCVRHLSSVGDPYLFPGDGGVHSAKFGIVIHPVCSFPSSSQRTSLLARSNSRNPHSLTRRRNSGTGSTWTTRCT